MISFAKFKKDIKDVAPKSCDQATDFEYCNSGELENFCKVQPSAQYCTAKSRNTVATKPCNTFTIHTGKKYRMVKDTNIVYICGGKIGAIDQWLQSNNFLTSSRDPLPVDCRDDLDAECRVKCLPSTTVNIGKKCDDWHRKRIGNVIDCPYAPPPPRNPPPEFDEFKVTNLQTMKCGPRKDLEALGIDLKSMRQCVKPKWYKEWFQANHLYVYRKQVESALQSACYLPSHEQCPPFKREAAIGYAFTSNHPLHGKTAASHKAPVGNFKICKKMDDTVKYTKFIPLRCERQSAAPTRCAAQNTAFKTKPEGNLYYWDPETAKFKNLAVKVTKMGEKDFGALSKRVHDEFYQEFQSSTRGAQDFSVRQGLDCTKQHFYEFIDLFFLCGAPPDSQDIKSYWDGFGMRPWKYNKYSMSDHFPELKHFALSNALRIFYVTIGSDFFIVQSGIHNWEFKRKLAWKQFLKEDIKKDILGISAHAMYNDIDIHDVDPLYNMYDFQVLNNKVVGHDHSMMTRNLLAVEVLILGFVFVLLCGLCGLFVGYVVPYWKSSKRERLLEREPNEDDSHSI